MEPSRSPSAARRTGPCPRGALLPDSRKRGILETWFRSHLLPAFEGRILPFDTEVALQYGELQALAEKSGRRFPIFDAILGATARCHNLSVVTRNEKDFFGSGVVVVNPWTDS